MKERLSFFVVLRRPIASAEVATCISGDEPLSQGMIERPIAENEFVQSTVVMKSLSFMLGAKNLRLFVAGRVWSS